MITAAFNFVPLSQKVFFPDWAEKVSHDVPFEDAQSGSIDITITAKSPIFVRDDQDEQEFCQHNGTPYIPASSVKGMVRNVLEIMSFSKMSQFNDDTYSVRDLSDAKNFYMKEMKKDTYCGWLKKEAHCYVIEDCGKPGRIKHDELDKIFEMDFASSHKKGIFGNKADDKTALRKYALIHSDNFKYPLAHTTTSTTGDKRYALDTSSSLQGTIVLTGQPSGRDEDRTIPSGKVYEFVFFKSKEDLKLRDEVMQNFLFAYFDKRTTEPKESPDWTYWKKKLEAGEKVPVFFQKNGKEVAHFGLSYLYKLPYTHSVKDGLPPAHKENNDRKDLAQTMFGYIGDDEALKGRVQFSHFKAVANDEKLDPRTEILGTPRASYYPMYVKQDEENLFKTFMNADFEISGWKRYPVHSGSKTVKTTETGNENVGTTFKPLKEGVVFQGKVRYHNLKKSELGALLSSLTFHNTKGCFHNIGMAKSLGYGKIELKLDGVDNLEEYLKDFEVEVSEQVENWSKTQQLKELLTMATEQENDKNSKLKYMELEQFAKNKTGDKDYLRNYTLLDSIVTVVPKSLITEADLEELREKQVKREEEEKERKTKKEREEKEEKEWHIVYESSNIFTIEAFIRQYPNSRYIKTAKEKIEVIEKELEASKLLEGQKEAIEEWKRIIKNRKYLTTDRIQKFMEDYPTSPKIADAKKELEGLGAKVESGHKVSIDTLCSVKDTKQFKSILDELTISEGDHAKIKECAIVIYNSLNKKKQKNFFKDSQLRRYVGEALEAEIKKNLGL